MSLNPSRREVEIKFRVGDRSQLEDLQVTDRRLAGNRLTPSQRKNILDIYWDTADYALTRGGFGLRTRRVDAEWQVTLKEMLFDEQSILADRIEVEFTPAPGEIIAFLAKPKLERLLSILRQEDALPDAWQRVMLHKKNPRLHPLVTLRQERHKRHLLSGNSADSPPIAELSLDTVDILPASAHLHPNDEDMGASSALTHFDEVEVEALGELSEADFEKIHRALNRKKSFALSTSSKPTTALRLSTNYTAEGEAVISPQTSMAEAGRQIWRQQLLEVILNECPIRTGIGDPVEAVHDMRVAIRRIRAAARIFGPYFVRKEVRPYLKTLRELAAELGKARDLDVSIKLVNQYRKAIQEPGDALTALKQTWKDERRRAYTSLTQRLSSKEHSRFIGQFANFCNTAGLGVQDPTGFSTQMLAAQEVRHVLPGEILLHYANMRVYESVLHDATPPEIFHDLRIEGKRLRYALEFVQHLLDPKPAADLIAKLKAVQECLGNMNDAVVMQERLHHFAATQPQAAPIGPVIGYLTDQIQQERARFVELWADFVSPATRRTLAIAVAAL